MARPMAWVKLETSMFDTPKIRRLRRQPNGNEMCLLWLMLITLAGKSGTSGKLMVADEVPSDIYDIAEYANMEPTFVGETLDQFITLNMIEVIDNGAFKICGWEEHQSPEKLEKRREQTLQRVRKHRAKQQQNVTCNANVTQCNATEEEEEEEEE